MFFVRRINATKKKKFNFPREIKPKISGFYGWLLHKKLSRPYTGFILIKIRNSDCVLCLTSYTGKSGAQLWSNEILLESERPTGNGISEILQGEGDICGFPLPTLVIKERQLFLFVV